jgi:hypothetical protein
MQRLGRKKPSTWEKGNLFFRKEGRGELIFEEANLAVGFRHGLTEVNDVTPVR